MSALAGLGLLDSLSALGSLEAPSNPWTYFAAGGVVVSIAIFKAATKPQRAPKTSKGT